MLKKNKYLEPLLKRENVTSKSGCYFRLSKFRDIKFGNWIARISFYDKNSDLIYHSKDTYAHDIGIDSTTFTPVIWSSDGLVIFYVEFRDFNSSENVVLFLEKKIRMTIPDAVTQPITEFARHFNDSNAEDVFAEYQNISLSKDELKKDPLGFFSIWYPR